MFRYVKHIIPSVFLTGLYPLIACCKLSFIIGSRAAFFSAGQLYIPLAGRWGGIQTSLLLYTLTTLYKVHTLGLFSVCLLSYHIPTLLGSIYCAWFMTEPTHTISLSKKLCMSGVAVLCMVLFGVHEVGKHALPYTFIWCIPAVTPFLSNHLFYHALSSTLITHAAGSVLWLYTHSMTAETWLSLIPIVYIERLLFAIGIFTLSRSTHKVHEALELLKKWYLTRFVTA